MRLRIVLFAVLSPGIFVQVEGQSKGKPTNQQAPADAKTAQSQGGQRGMENAPIFVHIIQNPQSEADAAKAKKDSDRKELYDLLITGSAVLAAIFTGCLVWVGYRGVRIANSTLRAIEIQTNAIIEAQRPQIVIGGNGNALEMLTYPLMVPSAVPRIELQIFNRGVTPAYNLTYETWIEILPEPFVDFTSNVDHVHPRGPNALNPQHPMIVNIPIPATAEQLQLVKRLELQACVRVRVVYDDAFRKGRCMDYGFIVMHNGLSFLPKYNGDCSESNKGQN